MQTQSQPTRICQSCIYESECGHCQLSQNKGKPIWFCEDFDSGRFLQSVANQKIHSHERSTPSSNPGTELISGRMTGLCISCADRVSCMFPIMEGGVWHCEEYC